MKATTNGGILVPIENCYIEVPPRIRILAYVLPEISDGKGATYNDEIGIGRSAPIKTYSHSDNRTVNVNWTFVLQNAEKAREVTQHFKALKSCVYPYKESDKNLPYRPPAICKIRCGHALDDKELCVILRNYSVNFPVDVPWDDTYLLPYKFSISLTWEVVYTTSELPGREKIIQ